MVCAGLRGIIRWAPWCAAITALLTGAPGRAETKSPAPPFEQSTELAVPCMVMPERNANGKFAYVYRDRTYYFCCKDCLAEFKASPDEYIEAAARGNAAQVTGDFLTRHGGPNATALLGALGSAIVVLVGVKLRRTHAKLSPALLYLAWVPLAGALYAQIQLERRQHRDTDSYRAVEAAREQFNFAVTHDFGYPPAPSKPPIPPRLRGTFYRGNDERTARLWNGGYYRTATFDLRLERKDRSIVDHGQTLPPGDLVVQLDIVRAPFTADEFWQPSVMDTMFLSRQADPIDGPGVVRDRVRLRVAEPQQSFTVGYTIGAVKGVGAEKVAGIIYVCEEMAHGQITGARYHLAIQYRVVVQDGVVQPESDLWMGALYRTRRVPSWKLPANEWFSHEPIPELPGPHQTQDPTALGLSDYQQKIEEGNSAPLKQAD